MVQHLDLPYHGHPIITQPFALLSAFEPYGYKYTDGSIGYHWEPNALYGRYHNGIDVALDGMSPLYACADGTVKEAGWDTTGFGWNILVDHGGDLYTHLAHLYSYAVNPGQRVTRGDLLGFSDSTGNSTGPHLHWDVRHSDGMGYYTFVDPAPYLAAPLPAPVPVPSAPHGPAPTFPTARAGQHYTVTVAMNLRSLPQKDATHTIFVAVGARLDPAHNPPAGQHEWETHWRWVNVPGPNKTGYAYAPNLKIAV